MAILPEARRKSAKKRSVLMAHEYLKPILNVVFRSKKVAGWPELYTNKIISALCA